MKGMQGNDGSFGRLFRYISGGNEGKQKVAMTTPVFMKTESELSDDPPAGQMGFVIPAKVAESQIPEPASSQVELKPRPAGQFAVIRFAGRLNPETRDQQLAKLQNWISERGLQIAGRSVDHECAGYDPPWTPGPLRRNEILIRLAD